MNSLKIRQMLNKVPEVTIYFWIIKVLCTTVGETAADYLNETLFAENKIKLVYQDFKHPQYKQCYEPFEPYMSIIDLLFNCSEASKKILFPTNTVERN